MNWWLPLFVILLLVGDWIFVGFIIGVIIPFFKSLWEEIIWQLGKAKRRRKHR